MTAQTTYNPHSRSVFKKFDILSASTISEVLISVEEDQYNIYSEIYRYTKLQYLTQDEAKADILYLLCEEADKRPEKFLERYNSFYWRFFITSFCKNVFGSSGSSRRNWKPEQQIAFFEDAPVIQEQEEVIDELQFFYERCIELVDKCEYQWWERKIWAVYRFDINDWKKQDWIEDGNFVEKAPKKITYDYIARRTEVSRTTVYKAVKKVDLYIKNNYESKFGIPPIIR
tara:strand:+ start:285 stop:971 length:687 start_codon:yes stop_codon:yes gene_type:complete